MNSTMNEPSFTYYKIEYFLILKNVKVYIHLEELISIMVLGILHILSITQFFKLEMEKFRIMLSKYNVSKIYRTHVSVSTGIIRILI